MAYEHRWMMFVDGENLTIRGEAVAKKAAIKLEAKPDFYMPGAFLWVPGSNPASWPYHGSFIRAYYYTSMVGDEGKLVSARDRLRAIGFDPQVFKKLSGTAKSKGVDITLTKDMLSHAFQNHYDRALLVAGDGDYIPLVQEVKRLGKLVSVMFFEDEGFNPELRRVADQFHPLTGRFTSEWRRS